MKMPQSPGAGMSCAGKAAPISFFKQTPQAASSQRSSKKNSNVPHKTVARAAVIAGGIADDSASLAPRLLARLDRGRRRSRTAGVLVLQGLRNQPLRVKIQHGLDDPAIVLLLHPGHRRGTASVPGKSVVGPVVRQVGGPDDLQPQPQPAGSLNDRLADPQRGLGRRNPQGQDSRLREKIFDERQLQLDGVVRGVAIGRLEPERETA